MKRFKKLGVILGIAIVILTPIIVQAATWEFKHPMYITDNSSVARSYYPVIIPSGLEQLSAYTLTGMDTNMQSGGADVQYMITNDKVLTVVPTLPANGRVIHDLYTGYSPSQTTFPIITGEGGYTTRADTPALELGDNWTISIRAYCNDVGNTIDPIIAKTNTFYLHKLAGLGASANVSTTDNETPFATTSAPAWVTPNDSWDDNTVTYAEYAVVFGNWSDYLTLEITNAEISRIRFWLTRETADINTIEIDKSANGATWYNIYTGDPGTYGAWFDYPISWVDTTYLRIRAFNNGGMVRWFRVHELQYSPVLENSRFSSWSNQVRSVTVTSNSTHLWLTVDGVDSPVKIATASMYDSANDWVIGNSSLNLSPYIQSVNITKGGNQIVRYEPNAVISGTTLPDRATTDGSQDGTITFGANTNIELSYGAIIYNGSTSASGNASSGYIADDMPMPSRWFGAYGLTPAQADASFAGVLFYETIHQQYIDGGYPTLTIYTWIFVGLSILVFLLLAVKTKSIAAAVGGMIIVLFFGSQVGTAGAIPLWVATIGLIMELALAFSYRQLQS